MCTLLLTGLIAGLATGDVVAGLIIGAALALVIGLPTWLIMRHAIRRERR